MVFKDFECDCIRRFTKKKADNTGKYSELNVIIYISIWFHISTLQVFILLFYRRFNASQQLLMDLNHLCRQHKYNYFTTYIIILVLVAVVVADHRLGLPSALPLLAFVVAACLPAQLDLYPHWLGWNTGETWTVLHRFPSACLRIKATTSCLTKHIRNETICWTFSWHGRFLCWRPFLMQGCQGFVLILNLSGVITAHQL